jgi:putative ABC transport system permease protein
VLGRTFLAQEDARFDQETVAMLSYGLWQRRFGGSPDVLDQTIHLNGRPHRVVGVMPPGNAALPARVDVFTAVGLERLRGNLGNHSLLLYGRLKPGVTPAQAESELAGISQRLGHEHPEARGWGVKVTPLTESVVGPVRPVLLSLLAAVGFLLLIACANVANLLLARGTARSREMAVRAAIGASRGRIVRQLLVESVLLALLGGALGLVIADVGLSALLAAAPATLPRAARIAVDGRALGFTFALTVITGVAFGLVPAFQAAGVRLQETLKQAGRGTSVGIQRQRLRAALVVGEVAIALWLLAGAGLLMRSFARLTDVDPGFEARDAHVATVYLPRPQYHNSAQHLAFARQAMAEIAAAPGVQAVAVAANIPFSDVHLTDVSVTTHPFIIPGRTPASEAEAPVSSWYTVSPTTSGDGHPLLRGRAFQTSDGPDAARVAIVSESVARKFFPGEDPLGKSIIISGPAPREIVGVVADVKPRSLDGDAGLQTYEAFAQEPTTTWSSSSAPTGRSSRRPPPSAPPSPAWTRSSRCTTRAPWQRWWAARWPASASP